MLSLGQFCLRTEELRNRGQMIAQSQSQLLHLLCDSAFKGIPLGGGMLFGGSSDGRAQERPLKRQKVVPSVLV